MAPTVKIVKVFCSTMSRDRELLGERVTDWLRIHPEIRVVKKVVSLSSDNRFHCLSIVLFCDRA
jgi:hypothetical protein